MTHPALFSLEDCVSALNAALELDALTTIDRLILRDMRDDLEQSAEINTFQDLVELANKQAKRGQY